MGRNKLVDAIVELLSKAEERVLIVIYNMLLRCAG